MGSRFEGRTAWALPLPDGGGYTNIHIEDIPGKIGTGEDVLVPVRGPQVDIYVHNFAQKTGVVLIDPPVMPREV